MEGHAKGRNVLVHSLHLKQSHLCSSCGQLATDVLNSRRNVRGGPTKRHLIGDQKQIQKSDRINGAFPFLSSPTTCQPPPVWYTHSLGYRPVRNGATQAPAASATVLVRARVAECWLTRPRSLPMCTFSDCHSCGQNAQLRAIQMVTTEAEAVSHAGKTF